MKGGGWESGEVEQTARGARELEFYNVVERRTELQPSASCSATTLEKTTVRKTGCLTAYNKN